LSFKRNFATPGYTILTTALAVFVLEDSPFLPLMEMRRIKATTTLFCHNA
jgi:hypothetical protein